MTQNPTLKRTPLYEAHIGLKARMVPFAGYEMPVQYSSVLDEAKATRSHGGIYDVSHMGQFTVRGSNALVEAQKLVSNDLSRLQIGQGQYNMLCNQNGGVIDDIIVYRRSENEVYICVNASNRTTDYEWMKSLLPSSVDFQDLSDETALIAIQGPQAEKIVATLTSPEIASTLKYYWACEVRMMGAIAYLSRTGYTGEDGFEIYLDNAIALKAWNQIREIGGPLGVIPCGLGARDTLRLEMGYPLHGHELSPKISPLEAGLGWVVKLQKVENFPGKQKLLDEQQQGPTKILRAFTLKGRRIAREGFRILDKSGQAVGTITSGTFSPHLNASIAMGFVDRGAASQSEFLIEIRQDREEASVTRLPFVPSRVKK